jgi:hypothetical protein
VASISPTSVLLLPTKVGTSVLGGAAVSTATMGMPADRACWNGRTKSPGCRVSTAMPSLAVRVAASKRLTSSGPSLFGPGGAVSLKCTPGSDCAAALAPIAISCIALTEALA